MTKGLARKGWQNDRAFGMRREQAFADVLLNSDVRYFEHKSDELCRITGHLFVEMDQCINGTWQPSGLSITKADACAFEFYPRCWVVVEVKALRSLVRDTLRSRGWVNGGDGNNYRGVLVPIERVVQIGRKGQAA